MHQARLFLYTLLSLAAALLPTRVLADETAWEKVGEQDGIAAYTLPVDADKFVSFKGETVIDADISDVADAMQDNATAPKWMPMVAERRNLKVIAPDHRIAYMHMKMPWPIADRYFLEDGRVLRQPDGSITLTVESVQTPEQAWLQADKVLASFHHSEFRLRPLSKGKTELVFELHSQAGGTVPTWLMNMAQQSWPFDFVHGLREELARRGKLHLNYAQAKLNDSQYSTAH